MKFLELLLGGQYLLMFVLLALYEDIFNSKKQFLLNLIPFYWIYELIKLAKKHYLNL